ncbi:UDP-2,3-diacylglucosamine diphosphatase [Marinomonas atlantica]|uniref:UDP-2,3-diacylglucosamine diphosphatase n=1 Tax=Marinomonas atlantica TaxID=1806668 RepID=UPI00083079D9|nr:UDP-2,3-diacylglucosamine diphosphatase [Marinomonas atlantica]MCO4784736.1 UDP-2,3-diacylglucosamine diphosphatase [Marinomonas atlantica]
MTRYFISDLHLSDKRLDLIQAFVYLTDQLCQCQEQPSELYILGDFFEAYIGDDYQPDWIKILDAQFAKLASANIATYFIAGNRDFLVGDDWFKRNCVTALAEQHIIHHNEQAIMLTHGDEYCIDDQAYQEFRAMVRQPAWQEQVLAMPLAQRLALAQKLRDDSKNMSADKQDAIMDVNSSAVEESVAGKVALLVHGHTHRPALHKTDKFSRLVLGDWDKNIWLATLKNRSIEHRTISVNSYLSDQPSIREWQRIHLLTW